LTTTKHNNNTTGHSIPFPLSLKEFLHNNQQGQNICPGFSPVKILPAPKGPGIDYNLFQWTVHSINHYNTKFPLRMYCTLRGIHSIAMFTVGEWVL